MVPMPPSSTSRSWTPRGGAVPRTRRGWISSSMGRPCGAEATTAAKPIPSTIFFLTPNAGSTASPSVPKSSPVRSPSSPAVPASGLRPSPLNPSPMRALLLINIFILATMRAGAAEEPIHKFAFGGGHSLPGEIQVTPANFYSEAAGYGFEPGAEVTAANGCITSTKAFYFSTKLPEGNYRVTVTFGDKSGDYTTTVKAELRRLMLEHIHTDSSQRVTRSFVVNLRGTRIGNEGEVRLKEREKTTEWWDWDDKLTLEFNDARPCVAAIEITQVEVPTLFILGDSTVCDQPTEPWNSWGQMLPRFFKPEIAVANHAESGETIAGALSAHRFGKVFSLMKAGDYLFVQFGHNDMKDKQPDAPQKYKARLRQVIAQTRACGGTPVVVTSMERKNGISHPTLAG